MPASSSWPDGRGRWRHRLLVAEAGVLLLAGRLLVAFVPFHRWRATLGRIVGETDATAGMEADPAPSLASLVAAHRRAVRHVPIKVKCLPQAMALQWMLRRRGIVSVLTIATLPKAGRGKLDDLHAWVAASGQILVGASPLPYVPVLRLQN
jgi:hypothetical protein